MFGRFYTRKISEIFLENFVIKLRYLNRQTILKVGVILSSQTIQWDSKRPTQGKGKGRSPS